MIVTLGERIKELRSQKGLTQAELVGVKATLSMIVQVEENKALPSYNLLSQIADKLETTVLDLIGDCLPTIEVQGASVRDSYQRYLNELSQRGD